MYRIDMNDNENGAKYDALNLFAHMGKLIWGYKTHLNRRIELKNRYNVLCPYPLRYAHILQR